MNKSERRSASSADCTTATEHVAKGKVASSGGRARPRARPQPVPKSGNGKTWTSNAKRNGEGKLSKCSVASAATPSASRHDKSGAFDSLLKRAQRRRSTGNTSEKAVSKHGTRSDLAEDDCSRPVELERASDESKNPKKYVEKQPACEEDILRDSSCYDSDESKKPVADPVEYTILARPDRQRAAAVSECQIPSSAQGASCEEENATPLLRDVLAPPKDLRFREKTRRSPVGSYADAAGAYAPYWPGPSQERGLYMPECRRPTFAPASRSAPVCIADELNYYKFAEAAVRPVLHYPEVYPPPPAPLVPPPVAPPAFPNDCVADRLCASRRRTRSFPRRLPERRLYDAHGRWVGHERRSLRDFDEEGWSLSVQHQPCRDGLCSHGGGRELRSNYDVPRGYGRRHSWSHSTVLDDDAEDLLPLIDKLAVDYANSDSSTEGTSETAHIPDEGSWFSVLPETTRPEDRFIWSPRRDLHRPRSVWSPIKPRLGGPAPDGFREPLTMTKYRFRTYTENVYQASVDAFVPFVEGRRSVSCDFPCFDDAASSSSAASSGEAHCAGWSPWSSQLPTADSLNVS